MSDKTRRVLAIILALAMVGSLAAGVILSSLGGGAANSAPDSDSSSRVTSGALYWEYHDAVYADGRRG